MKKLAVEILVPESEVEIVGKHKRAKAFLYDFANRLNGDLSTESVMKTLDNLVSFLVELSSQIVIETFFDRVTKKDDDSPVGPLN